MARLIVEIPMDGTVEEVKTYIEKHRDSLFPVGNNFLSVYEGKLKQNPTENDSYLFKLVGILDDEKTRPEKK